MNPQLAVEPGTDRLEGIARRGELDLDFTVPGAERAWGYSTAGGFLRPSEDVSSEGEVSLQWFAPEKGDADLYVVFEDGDGGTTVWSAEAWR